MPNVGKPLDDQTRGPGAPPTSKAKSGPMVSEDQIKGSMHTEEPVGADLSEDSNDPKMKRHPRPDGKGGIVPAHEEGEGIIEERE